MAVKEPCVRVSSYFSNYFSLDDLHDSFLISYFLNDINKTVVRETDYCVNLTECQMRPHQLGIVICDSQDTDKVEKEYLPVSSFCEKYLMPVCHNRQNHELDKLIPSQVDHSDLNKLCLIKLSAINKWKASQSWVFHDGSINHTYINAHYGSCKVPVVSCQKSSQNGEYEQQTMDLNEFLNYLANCSGVENNLYLKDWHFAKFFPDAGLYETPIYFMSDWLNEYCDCRNSLCGAEEQDDYRFVYLGPAGSWTPFHADVLRTHSWSANVSGSKKWTVFPPGTEKHLEDRLGNLPTDVSGLLDQLSGLGEDEKPLILTQRPGEVIFVPSGWYHQVVNMSDVTLSVNHNWFNASNVCVVWSYLESSLLKVEDAISDCKDMDDWPAACQRILKADSGMDMWEFYLLILTILYNRLSFLSHHTHGPPLPLHGHISTALLTSLTHHSILPCHHHLHSGGVTCSVCRRLSQVLTTEPHLALTDLLALVASEIHLDLRQIQHVLGAMQACPQFEPLHKQRLMGDMNITSITELGSYLKGYN